MSPFYRQNDKEALTYLKASYYCFKKEREVKYFVIAISFFVCLCGIFNRYLPVMFAYYADIIVIQNILSLYINLLSGAVIILSILLSFYTSVKHLEGVVLQEHYECYIFNFPLNHSLLKPISQSVIKIYASKIKRRDEKFINYYFSSEDDVDNETGMYDNLNIQFHDDHRLYMSVQSFFLTIWIGFCIIIFIIAISFDDKFINTLINILFPSLSAITTIGSSWFAFTRQIKQLNNAIAVIDNIQRTPDKERNFLMTDRLTLRMLQDSMFSYRASPFVIPTFLVKSFKKQVAKESWDNIRRSSDLIIGLSQKTLSTKYLNKMIEQMPPSQEELDVKTLCLPAVQKSTREKSVKTELMKIKEVPVMQMPQNLKDNKNDIKVKHNTPSDTRADTATSLNSKNALKKNPNKTTESKPQVKATENISEKAKTKITPKK